MLYLLKIRNRKRQSRGNWTVRINRTVITIIIYDVSSVHGKSTTSGRQVYNVKTVMCTLSVSTEATTRYIDVIFHCTCVYVRIVGKVTERLMLMLIVLYILLLLCTLARESLRRL